MDVIVNSLREVDFTGMKMPIITIYEKPIDYPDGYIARVFELEKPTNTLIHKSSLEECRADIKAAGFKICVPRSENDVLSVVESWI